MHEETYTCDLNNINKTSPSENEVNLLIKTLYRVSSKVIGIESSGSTVYIFTIL